MYAAEEIIGAGQKWHTECFSCLTCKTRLSSTTLTEKEGEIYCTTCYSKQFGQSHADAQLRVCVLAAMLRARWDQAGVEVIACSLELLLMRFSLSLSLSASLPLRVCGQVRRVSASVRRV